MSVNERKQTVREAKELKTLDHTNILKFTETYKLKHQDVLCIVMDHASGGHL